MCRPSFLSSNRNTFSYVDVFQQHKSTQALHCSYMMVTWQSIMFPWAHGAAILLQYSTLCPSCCWTLASQHVHIHSWARPRAVRSIEPLIPLIKRLSSVCPLTESPEVKTFLYLLSLLSQHFIIIIIIILSFFAFHLLFIHPHINSSVLHQCDS